MQQSYVTTTNTISQGPQVVYVPAAQMAPAIYDSYSTRKSITFGIIQIVIGALCIIFNIVIVAVSADPSGGVGFWCGSLFIVTGSFGITAGQYKTRCPIVTFMVLCIVSAVFTIVLIALGILGAIMFGCPFRSGYSCYNPQSLSTQSQVVVAMASLLAIAGLFEAIVAIWGAVICCQAGACWCSHSGTPTQTQPVTVAPPVGYYLNNGQVANGYNTPGGQYGYENKQILLYPQAMVQQQPAYYSSPTVVSVNGVMHRY